MYLKPRRFRSLFAFLAGISISILFLAGGLFWMQQREAALRERIGNEVRQEVEADWSASHPMEAVYLFAKDMKAGTVVMEKDLLLQEASRAAVPEDAVRSPEDAVGSVMRGDVKANMLCAQSSLYREGEYPDDARIQEYSAVRLPQKLEKNDSVDVRVMFPNGLDYVILSKKAVRDLQRDESGAGNLVWFTMTEEELLRMSSAVVDAFLHPGTILYAVTYVAPDIQAAAVCTYPVNPYVQELMRLNPNILSKAATELGQTSRDWFDSIPDPQPQQPLAVVPPPPSDIAAGTVQVKQTTPLAADPAETAAESQGGQPGESVSASGQNGATAESGATAENGAKAEIGQLPAESGPGEGL